MSCTGSPVFDSMADDWLSGGQRRRQSGKPPGAAVGFGIENLLLTQLAFPIITAAIGGVLGNVGQRSLPSLPVSPA